MTSLVTLAEAKAHLRVYWNDEDANITSVIEQAQDIVLDYIKKPDAEWIPEDVPARVKSAILMIVTALYQDDDNGAKTLSGLSGGDISNPVVAVLYRLRDPALA